MSYSDKENKKCWDVVDTLAVELGLSIAVVYLTKKTL